MSGNDEVVDEVPEFLDPSDIAAEMEAGGGDHPDDAMSDGGGSVMLDPPEITEVEDPTAVAEDDDTAARFAGHAGEVYAVALQPVAGSTLCLSGGGDDVGLLWDTATGTVRARLAGHGDSVVDVAFSHDGALCGTASLDGTVRVWSAAGEPVAVCDGPTDGIEWLRWHPRGHVILAGSTDGIAWMWNAQGSLMAAFTGHAGAVNQGCFFGEGARHICTVSEDATLKVWDPRSGVCARTVSGFGYHEAGIVGVDVHHNGVVAATAGRDNSARLCNLETGRILGTVAHPEYVETVAFAPGPLPFLATGCGDGGVRVWDTNTLQARQLFMHEATYSVVKVAWEPSHGALLLTASTDGTVRLWDTRANSSEPAKVLKGARAGILDFAFNFLPSGQMQIVSGSEDKQALVFLF